jgi:glutathione S-transferase
MPELKLTVLSLRYSSWSMRPWLALTQAGARFETETVELESFETTTLAERRALGSVSGLFPILRVDGSPIHESLAISEYVAEAFPEAELWPAPMLERARARALCAEMVGDFAAIRSEMSCHLFARVPDFAPSDKARANVDRVFEIWTECLSRSGGPFLFGTPSLADFFYYPVLTRFRTYGVELAGGIEPYAESLENLPAVAALIDKARTEPLNAVYDEYVLKLGGNPNAALRA